MMAPTGAVNSSRKVWAAVFAVLTLTVVSVVPWRIGDLYDGGIDPVVIAKALLGGLSFGAGFLLMVRSPTRSSIGIRSLGLLAGIVLVSLDGAFAAGGPLAAVVLTVRIALVAATIVVVVRSAPPMTVLTALLAAMAVVTIVAAVTGLQSGLAGGRLAGGTPQMAPNVLAGLAAPPVIGLAAHIVHKGLRPWNVGLLVIHVAIVFATGSRTALIVVVVGIALAFLCGGRLAASTAIVTIAAIPFAYGLVAFTDTISTVLARGQTVEQISTLSSRTVAWEAVLSTPWDSWAKWIGVGLAAKTVEVQQRWRDVQVLDSSWVSVIAQAGIIGTVLLLIWMVWTTVEAVRTPSLSALAVPLMVILIVRSFTENGVIESSTTFMLFLSISLLLEPGTRFPSPLSHPVRYQMVEPLPVMKREPATTAS
ncbi:O-antigen ligase family protein [Glaciihabitans sp. INWT7]|nr:O-antigen ligase family protein [Glaciihabitans sp. INWT7]